MDTAGRTLRFDKEPCSGRRGPELEDRIDAELAAFDLAEFSGHRNETLSHGTRQRVALAQAFLHDPEVLVLDGRWSAWTPSPSAASRSA